MAKFISTNKAQVWGLDLIVALIIFFAGIISIYYYSINLSSEAEENLDSLLYEGNLIASNLFSEGNPSNWSGLSVDEILMPGILTDGKIDDEKIILLNNFLISDSKKIKTKLNTQFDFCFKIIDSSFSSQFPEGICTASFSSDVANNVKITIFSIYKNTPRKIELNIWK